jgi:hypothetical protein
MVSTGPGKLKSKPNFIMMSNSSSISAFLVTYFYSSIVKRVIIRLKDGDVSYSSLADSNVEMVANRTYYLSWKFQCPIIFKYRSNMF